MTKQRTLPLFAVLAALATQAAPAQVVLSPCKVPGVDQEIRCGTYAVFEDRAARSGRTIPLFIAVLPALESPAALDPVFMLAGGPGQGASSLAGFANRSFAGIRRHRDIVMVDLAGTGRSQPLNCRMYRTAQDLVGDFHPLANVRVCHDSLSHVTNLKRYTTANLVDDLDDARAALGYDSINIYGTSWGTRAALEYVRRHRGHVRSIVLKAVAPPTMPGTMYYARDMDRSLDELLRLCDVDRACLQEFPTIRADLDEVLKRAEKGFLPGVIPDPRGRPTTQLPITRGAFTSLLLGYLQNTATAVRIPFLIHEALMQRTEPLVTAIVNYRSALDANVSIGFYFSVMCNEDAPRMDAAAAVVKDAGTALKDYRVAQLAAACREWGEGDVSADAGKPVVSDVPALLISGTLDPNTPEPWGEEALRTLSHGTHVVITNVSHAFTSIAECGANFITPFIETASAAGLDFSCKDNVRIPRFVFTAQ